MTPASGTRHTLGFARPSSNLLLPHFVALRRCFHPSPLLFVSFQAFVMNPGAGLGFTSPWKELLEAAQGSGRSTVGQGSHPGSWSCPAAGSWQRGQSRGCSSAQCLQRCPGRRGRVPSARDSCLCLRHRASAPGSCDSAGFPSPTWRRHRGCFTHPTSLFGFVSVSLAHPASPGGERFSALPAASTPVRVRPEAFPRHRRICGKCRASFLEV